MTALINMLTYALIMSITPGPNNVICMAQGTSFGFKKSLPHMYGVVIGCLSQQWLILLLGGMLGDAIYNVTKVVSYFGAAYILWLAYKMTKSHNGGQDSQEAHKPMTIYASTLLQYANPKAYIFNVTIISSFILPMNLTMGQNLMLSSITGIIFLLCNGTWVLFGQGFNQVFKKYQRQLGYVFGIMLAYLAVSIVIH